MNATTRQIIFERVGWHLRSISDIENMNYQRYLISACAGHNFDFIIKMQILFFVFISYQVDASKIKHVFNAPMWAISESG